VEAGEEWVEVVGIQISEVAEVSAEDAVVNTTTEVVSKVTVMVIGVAVKAVMVIEVVVKAEEVTAADVIAMEILKTVNFVKVTEA